MKRMRKTAEPISGYRSGSRSEWSWSRSRSEWSWSRSRSWWWCLSSSWSWSG
jgi:hypothetical protein